MDCEDSSLLNERCMHGVLLAIALGLRHRVTLELSLAL